MGPNLTGKYSDEDSRTSTQLMAKALKAKIENVNEILKVLICFFCNVSRRMKYLCKKCCGAFGKFYWVIHQVCQEQLTF